MTPQQKAIVKKLGRVPQVKGSTAYKMFHQAGEVKKEARATRKAISSHSYKEPSEHEKRSYQHRVGRAYSE